MTSVSVSAPSPAVWGGCLCPPPPLGLGLSLASRAQPLLTTLASPRHPQSRSRSQSPASRHTGQWSGHGSGTLSTIVSSHRAKVHVMDIILFPDCGIFLTFYARLLVNYKHLIVNPALVLMNSKSSFCNVGKEHPSEIYIAEGYSLPVCCVCVGQCNV